jgi:TRAP-type C4-dicarboxylate transport system substrate-binding protein
MELRAHKDFNYIGEQFRKGGIQRLGYAIPVPIQSMLYIFTNKAINKVEDFKGLKLATPSPFSVAFFKALGAVPVVVPLQDFYTAMERGVVQGFIMTQETTPAFGLHKVSKYMIDHPYATSADSILIGLKLWNSLAKDVQDIFMNAAVEFERSFPDVYVAEMAGPGRKQMAEAGMEFVKLPPAEARKFTDLYREATWEVELKKHPVEAARMKEILTKK